MYRIFQSTKGFIIEALLVCAILQVTKCCNRGSVRITENGYSGILIAIAETVPEDRSLLRSICDSFIECSQTLYEATKKRAYFANITVLVPESWEGYYEEATAETFDKADIIIEPSPYNVNTPFVINPTPCGQSGHYMHLTPEFLMNETVGQEYGSYGKILLHEWAHLRWGIFDEYPLPGGPNFYATSGGQIEAVKCSQSLTGKFTDSITGGRCRIGADGLPEDTCRFEDVDRQSETGYASLMYRTNMEQVEEFCDNNPVNVKTLHSREAPTQQNIQCGLRSVWEVIQAHPDFSNDSVARDIEDTEPEFHFVQRKQSYVVLVLDISGSMQNMRIRKLGQGCNNYITNVIKEGQNLGIVWFNDDATRAANFTKINNETRASLLDSVPRPRNVGGSTSIASGLLEAFDMLSDSNGGTIIVLTDGEETVEPKLEQISEEIRDAPVTIHSIAITDLADRSIDVIVSQKGGLSYIYSGEESSNAINQAFRNIGNLDKSPARRGVTILSRGESLESNGTTGGTLSIDNTLGRDTQFVFDYSGSDIAATVISPSGEEYTITDDIVTHDVEFGIYRFYIPDAEFEPGHWQYSIRNLDSNTALVAISVVSSSADPDAYPITAMTYWGRRSMDNLAPDEENQQQILYAAVSQGFAPVLNADVVAMVETSTGITQLPLLDNGAGSDTLADDGIYSAYFLSCNASGRYGVQISVNSTEATKIMSKQVIGRTVPISNSNGVINDLPDIAVTDLQRTTLGPSFQLQNITNPGNAPLYPPGRITDLRVTNVSYERLEVSLEWTAVGSQLDRGTASSYELRYSTEFDSIVDDFANQAIVTMSMKEGGITNLEQPFPAGEKEQLTIRVPTRGEVSYVFAIVARDTSGSNVTGPLSNIASVSLADTNSESTSTMSPVVEITIEDKPTTTEEYDELSTFTIAMLAGGITFALVVCVLIVALVAMEFTPGKRHNLKRGSNFSSTYLSSLTYGPRRNNIRQKHYKDYMSNA